MDLRDNLLAQAPYLVDEGQPDLPRHARARARRPVPVPGRDRLVSTRLCRTRTRARSSAARENDNAVIDEDVLWSCTMCGACVNQCPVDIEHIDHIVDMRRNRVMIESEFPSELDGLFKNVENKGNPWGAKPRSATRGSRRSTSRSECLRRRGRHPRRRRLPVLGRLRRRVRGPREEHDEGRGRAAEPGRRALHGARRGRDLHRRPRAPRRQRVPVPDAGDAERRDAQRDQGEEDRRHLPALHEHHRPRVPAARRQLRRRAPLAAARDAGQGRPPHAGDPGRRPQRHGDLPRPLLPRPPQQGLHAAARAHRLAAGPLVHGDGALGRPLVLLRRRRRAHVDGGAASARASTSTAPTRRSAPVPRRSRWRARSAR